MDKADIVAGLQSLGLKKGNVVLLHSSLGSLGHVEGGAATVIDGFLETLGSEGTLVAPVFGDLGVLTETVKEYPGSVISDCPAAAVAAVGADAEFICRDHWEAATAHGEGTPYLKVAELGGYICLLGVDQDRNTTMHSVEALLELPYLKPKIMTRETANGAEEKSFPYFPGPHRDFIGLDHVLRENGLMKVGRIGNATVRLMKSREMIDFLVGIGKCEPAFCLCGNPHCADCVAQRADIRRAELKTEAFTLAAAASVAGRHVAEIIDNLRAVGIDCVELDYLRGRPAHSMPFEELKEAVEVFQANGIAVSALRLPAVPADFDEILKIAAECGIERVILPLPADAEKFAKQAASATIKVSFANVAASGKRSADIMKGLRTPAGFTFSPAGFAKAGEMPFLTTYRIGKFRKYADQLDIEDGLFDGTPTGLASGNAEIKELISIFRAFNFSGFMTLSGSNRPVTLSELAKAFEELLHSL